MTKLQPFGIRVAVLLEDKEENLGGIIVTTSKNNSNRGVVAAVGDGKDVKDIKVGDTVIFSLHSGIDYSEDTLSYKVIDLRDIIGKVIGE